jgi:hypothetical protein
VNYFTRSDVSDPPEWHSTIDHKLGLCVSSVQCNTLWLWALAICEVLFLFLFLKKLNWSKKLWVLTWTAVSLYCRFFSASVNGGYSGLPVALCLMSRQSSDFVQPGSLAEHDCKEEAEPLCWPISGYPESKDISKKCLGEINLKKISTFFL